MVFNQLLLTGGEELRVLHILQREVTLMRLPLLFFQLAVKVEGVVSSVEDSIQKELHRGLLGLAGRRGQAGDQGGRENCAVLRREETILFPFSFTFQMVNEMMQGETESLVLSKRNKTCQESWNALKLPKISVQKPKPKNQSKFYGKIVAYFWEEGLLDTKLISHFSPKSQTIPLRIWVSLTFVESICFILFYT